MGAIVTGEKKGGCLLTAPLTNAILYKIVKHHQLGLPGQMRCGSVQEIRDITADLTLPETVTAQRFA